MNQSIRLRCGTLHLSIDRANMDIEALCGYASRRSRKRGFVFVSKVLGKHYPVRPRQMVEVHERLAAKVDEMPGPVAWIALAETATGLGQGVYESWLRHTGRTDSIFLHTTRYFLDHPVALRFEEPHSHAIDHLLYEPIVPAQRQLLREARTLVLVDDEITTGRTLANLARAFADICPNLACVKLLCITSWLAGAQHQTFGDQMGLPTTLNSLTQGTFRFEEDRAFNPGSPPNANGPAELKDAYLQRNHGRLGIAGLLDIDLDSYVRPLKLKSGERLLVLGSGEFAYPPYLLARYLENLGWDVHFQSTTRSPLLVDRDIASILEFADNYHDNITNYLYNVSGTPYDRILIGYETWPLPDGHQLPEVLGATPIFF